MVPKYEMFDVKAEEHLKLLHAGRNMSSNIMGSGVNNFELFFYEPQELVLPVADLTQCL